MTWLLTIEKFKHDGDVIVMGFRFNTFEHAYLVMNALRLTAESALKTRMYITDVNGETRAIMYVDQRNSFVFPNDN